MISSTKGLTVGTAKTHTNHIYRKVDVRSRTQAVARATEMGFYKLQTAEITKTSAACALGEVSRLMAKSATEDYSS